MSVTSVGNEQSLAAAMLAAKRNVARAGSGETKEPAAQERAESGQVQAAEGETGGIINTYA